MHKVEIRHDGVYVEKWDSGEFVGMVQADTVTTLKELTSAVAALQDSVLVLVGLFEEQKNRKCQ